MVINGNMNIASYHQLMVNGLNKKNCQQINGKVRNNMVIKGIVWLPAYKQYRRKHKTKEYII